MQIIEYDPNHGHAIGDGDVEMMVGDIIKDLANGYNNPIALANESVFLAIRLAIAEGRIDYRAIQFKFKRQILTLDQWGYPVGGAPEGFCDQEQRTRQAMLRARSRMA